MADDRLAPAQQVVHRGGKKAQVVIGQQAGNFRQGGIAPFVQAVRDSSRQLHLIERRAVGIEGLTDRRHHGRQDRFPALA